MTNAGLLLFGKRPQDEILSSQTKVTAVGTPDFLTVVNGTPKSEGNTDGVSTFENVIQGNLWEQFDKINEFLGELEQIGCEFKGFDQGLVDFHGRLDEREILWCWKFGEDRITHWHELEAGFAGRQPLPEVLSRS